MKTHRIHLILAAFCALPGLLAAQTITTGVPGFISYQGKVLNNTGGLVGSPTPVNRTVIFRVWDHPSNTLTGNLIYSEQQTVTIADGEFSVLVGQGVATTGSQFGYSETAKKLADIATAFGGSTRYLGVTVDDGTAAVDNEITPRQQIVSSAFSFRSKFAENLGTSASTALTTVDSGNVGVGNTNPTARFMVTAAGTGTGSPQMIVTADDTTERLRIGVDSTGTGTGYIQSFKEGTGAQNLLLNPGGGRVGIGTTTPAATLDVRGTGSGSKAQLVLVDSANSSASTASFVNVSGWGNNIATDTGSTGRLWYVGSSSASSHDISIWNQSNAHLALGTNNTERVRVTNTGNVGIGQTNPGAKLDVNGNISATGNLSVTGTNGSFSTPFFPPSGTTTLSLFVAGVGVNEPQMRFNRTSDGQFYDIGMNGSNGFVIDDNDTPRLTINSAGNVGIGESNPTARLHVNGAIQVANDNNITGLNALVGFNDLHLSGDPGTTDLFISSNGQVAIGPNVIYNNVTFQVRGRSGDDLVAMFRNPSGSDAFYFWNNGAAEKIGGTAWTALSDRRVKENVVEITGALEKLLKLRSVSFEYKDPAKHGEGKYNGFIAQEVETVYPDWVSDGMDGMKRLTINGFESLAVQAFRELRQEKNAQISKLEEANKELQARLKKLESSNSDSASAGLSNAELLERLALLEARDKAREAKLAAIEKLLLENGQPAAQPVSLKKAANDAE
ncbi:MAG TPA: hypothetical protein DIT64_07135 [Verrucomicrobiales bacterium]|nr:hypothetical protein [Verrucomicrobiales bacterium]